MIWIVAIGPKLKARAELQKKTKWVSWVSDTTQPNLNGSRKWKNVLELQFFTIKLNPGYHLFLCSASLGLLSLSTPKLTHWTNNNKMASSNALSSASILCSPKQVLYYTVLQTLFLSLAALLFFWKIYWWVCVIVFVGRVEEERQSAKQLKAELWAIKQKVFRASKCQGYCIWSELQGCPPIRNW